MATDEKKQSKPIYDFEKQTITWPFRTLAARVLHMDLVSAENTKHAAYVGFGQVRIKDATAIGRADANGVLIAEDIRERIQHEAMGRLIEWFETPGNTEWTMKAGPRAVKGPDYALIREALARVKMAEEKIAAMDEAQLQRMASVGKVAEAMALITAERIVPVADAEDEFTKLLGE